MSTSHHWSIFMWTTNSMDPFCCFKRPNTTDSDFYIKNVQRIYFKRHIRTVILIILLDACSPQPMEPILHQTTLHVELLWAAERNLNIWVSDLWTLGFDHLGVYLFSWPLTLVCWPLICWIYHLCSPETWPCSEMGASLPWHAIT